MQAALPPDLESPIWGDARPHVNRDESTRPRGAHSPADKSNKEVDNERSGWPLDESHPVYRRFAAAQQLGVDVSRVSFGITYAGEEDVIVRPQPSTSFNYA